MNKLNFNLRGVKPDIMEILKKQAKKQNTSVNSLILEFIKRGLGYSHVIKKTTYHDLDKLAGTWSDKDTKELEKNTKDFEKIDKDLW